MKECVPPALHAISTHVAQSCWSLQAGTQVVWPPGQVHFARRDHRGQPAVEPGLDEVHGPLARCEVAEDRMAVGIDQPRNDGAALGVYDGVGVAVEAPADGRDLLAVLVHEEHDLGVGVDAELRDDLLDLVELLLVHDDVGRRHSVILL
jgi:hypothetical protein